MTTLNCPNCYHNEIQSTNEIGFIEIGEYDEHMDQYRREFHVYEYECKNCGQQFWIKGVVGEKKTAKPPLQCNQCGMIQPVYITCACGNTIGI